MPDFVPTFGERDFTPQDTYRGQSNLTATPMETAESTFDQAYGTGTTQAAAALFLEGQDNTGQKLSAEQANQQVKDENLPGLHFDQPVSQSTLSLQVVRQQDYLKNKEIMDNGSGFATTTVGGMGIGLGASFLDPIDFALNFTGAGLAEKLGIGAKALEGASLARSAALRLGQGALDNAPVNVGIGAANWYEASQEQRDFGVNDFLKSVAYGEVMGSVIHAGAGAVGDVSTRVGTNMKIRDILPPNAQMEALQLSNQSVYNFNDILGVQPKVIAAEKFLGRDLSQNDRISLLSREPQENLPENADLNLPEGALPSDQALAHIDPETIAQEKVSRLKDLINGPEPVTPQVKESESKVTLDSEPIAHGNIDEELAQLEKSNEDLKQQVMPAEEPEPKEGEPELIDHTPQYGEEGSQLINNSKAEVANADKDIQALPTREKAIKNAVGCFMSAVSGE